MPYGACLLLIREAVEQGLVKQLFLIGSDARLYELPTERTVMIGRAPINSIVLNDRLVSRVHAHIEPSARGHRLIDRDSANGTLVNGHIVKEAILNHGDRVQIGNYVFHVFHGTREEINEWLLRRKSDTRSDHTLMEISTDHARETDITGDLAVFNMISLLQMLVEQKRNGALTLTRYGEFRGRIYFTNGSIVCAQSAEGPGGKAALFELMALDQGQFRFRPNIRPPSLDIMENPTSLLLQACQHLDEKRSR